MQKMIKIRELKKGDRISGTNGSACQVISVTNNELFYYNEGTREFHTKKINLDDLVYLEE